MMAQLRAPTQGGCSDVCTGHNDRMTHRCTWVFSFLALMYYRYARCNRRGKGIWSSLTMFCNFLGL